MEQEHEEGASDSGKRRAEIQEKRTSFRVTAMEKDGKIANFLWNFMKEHGKGCCDAHAHVHEVAARDEDAVHRIMRAVADQAHDPERAGTVGTIDDMAVMPVNEFFQEEREEDARSNSEGSRRKGSRTRLSQLREDVDEHIANEAAHGKANEEEETALHTMIVDACNREADEGDQAHNADAADTHENRSHVLY